MLTTNSISGGKTSAYVAAHYPADYNVFALVRTMDERLRFPDEKLRREVEYRINKPFVGTLEDNLIVRTILDLEQHIGRPITWVSGIPFEEVVETKGGWLPNKLHRYCTTWMKLEPMFNFWRDHIGEPTETRIGYRANELKRANKMLKKADKKTGLIAFKGVMGTWEKGTNKGKKKWELTPWQKPRFPLIEDNIFRDDITNYWEGKPVVFADYNNCVGCFHRNPVFLRYMFDREPDKMEWFSEQEVRSGSTWRSDLPYARIKSMLKGVTLGMEDFSSCDSGYCGM